MNNFQLTEDCSGVRCENHLLQVVDNNLVAAIRTKRRLDGLGDGLAGLDVANDSTIFGVMAKNYQLGLWFLLAYRLRVLVVFVESSRGSVLSGNRLPLVARLEKTGLGRSG